MTADGVQIVGDWVAAPTTIGAVILLHMMPATRSSWSPFQIALAKRGLASLAIDLRGHGDSTRGSEDQVYDYKEFADEEHRSSLFDVIGAFQWLKKRGFEPSRIGLCGASIGANLAIEFLCEEPAVTGAVLLSPGRDYQGLDAVFDIGGVLPHQAIWIAASEGDDQESFEASKAAFAETCCARKAWVPFKNSGHGTELFKSHPQLLDQVAEWLRDTIQGI